MSRLVFVLALLCALAFAQLPESYNVRDVYPECTIPVLDQGQCGSCWAHSTVEALSERFCIASKGKMKPLLSPQYLNSCDRGSSGCNGGDTIGAYKFISQQGNDDVNCTKYTSGKTGQTGPCPSTCDDKKPITQQDLYFASKGYSLDQGSVSKNIIAMQNDIYTYGPISASFVVRQDFMDFFRNPATKTSVYRTTMGRVLGGHAIMVVGWGAMNVNGTMTPYWQCVNSWGQTWGDNGMFKIIRGIDDCTIESRRLSAGIPRVSSKKSAIIRKEHHSSIRHSKSKVCDGCWTKQDTFDPMWMDIAQTLLSAHNKAFTLNKIVQVKTRVVRGVEYQVTAQAQDWSRNGKETTITMVTYQDVHRAAWNLVSIQ